MSRRMADVDPAERGISWSKYLEQQYAIWRKEAAALHPEGEEPEINGKRIATARDSYGWRSLPNGRTPGRGR